jgi:hypothetical protein
MKKKKKQLTIKQQRTAMDHVVNNVPIKQAVANNYNVTNPNSASIIGTRLLNSPKFQNFLQAELEKQFPQSRATRFQVLHEILEDPKMQPNARMKAIEIVNKMVGDQAATRHERAEVKVTLPKLPGSKD